MEKASLLRSFQCSLRRVAFRDFWAFFLVPWVTTHFPKFSFGSTGISCTQNIQETGFQFVAAGTHKAQIHHQSLKCVSTGCNNTTLRCAPSGFAAELGLRDDTTRPGLIAQLHEEDGIFRQDTQWPLWIRPSCFHLQKQQCHCLQWML